MPRGVRQASMMKASAMAGSLRARNVKQTF
jgi:hypothetical protein